MLSLGENKIFILAFFVNVMKTLRAKKFNLAFNVFEVFIILKFKMTLRPLT
ncbi:hypothetical protein CJS3_1034 [Campylobacter jejuni subsp. jejuni S3]|nr:hypothetical protein CJS3_1034 [Campylobacter jejuni subsp. jejuni S3]